MKTAAFALAALLVLPALPAAADPAQNGPWLSAFSLTNPDAKPVTDHWDYVNPNAPKGGLVRLPSFGGFDTFNPILPEGEPADGLGLVYETLMQPSLDDSNSSFPSIAEAFAYPPDVSSTTFRINPKAKWQDGTPITPQDVVWSFEEEMKLNPNLQQYYQDVTKVEVTAPDQVTFSFSSKNNRELPGILGQLLVLPQHWWEGKDANGKQRNIGASTLEPPMGSGPYKLSSFNAGSSITYARDPNYWAASEPTEIGTNNFDTIRYEYFRDPDVAFEGFKGDQFDWWSENRAKRWATAYDFPAVQDKKVVMELYPQTYADNGTMVGFIPNLRNDKFKDLRVRKALNFAFDFESLNKTLFYGQYERISSYFYGTPLASSGLPQGAELDDLNAVKDKVPPEVFTATYANPVNGSPEAVRSNLREATRLLRDAGYEIRDRKLVDAKSGEPLTVEVLIAQPEWERIVLFYRPSLERLGIELSVRYVDDAQYENRLRNRDYDMIVVTWGQGLSPGNEQRGYWSSQAADMIGSRNYVGIKNPAVDTLIDRIIFAKSRDELVAATKALDRVLLWNHYVVPQWTYGKVRTARWDRFGRPADLPKYGSGAFPTIWWWDQAKATKVGSRS